MIFVDSHVHIYNCFDVDKLFDTALKNFQAAAKKYGDPGQPTVYMLLLTEGKDESWFQNITARLDQGVESGDRVSNRWYGVYSKDNGCLTVFIPESPDEKIHLIAGRQVVTSEDIEVLSLFCVSEINQGMPLKKTVETVKQQEGIPVLPWGVGKWFGKRGKVIESFLHDHAHDILFVGDNGGRPSFWPTPTLFSVARKRGLSVLQGSDPLPLPGEISRVGSFGFYVDENVLNQDSPVTCLKNALLSSTTSIKSYGHLQKNWDFLTNQVRLRLSSLA